MIDCGLMAETDKKIPKNKLTPDWLVNGVLTKLGEMFDRLTGRNWQPSSSLATSEISEKLKKLLDAEVKDLGVQGLFVPHNIKLKMQWDKFSTDADASIKKLENELLITAIDHINDRRYHTFAPLLFEIKPDYFTEGVKLMASFDKFADEESREAAVNVTVPDLKNISLTIPEPPQIEAKNEMFTAEYVLNGKEFKAELIFHEKQRLSVGRTKENDLTIDDPSISKIHASLVLNNENQLMVADTGSTNGTFISGQRIVYGKAIAIRNGEIINFGTVSVKFEHIPNERPENVAEDFRTNSEFRTEDVSAGEMASTPTVLIANEDSNNYVTNSGNNIEPEKDVAENKIHETKDHFELEYKDDNAEDSATPTNKGIILDFGENK